MIGGDAADCSTICSTRTVLSVPPGSLVGMALTDTEAQMLNLERSWWKYAGEKERVIRERFGLSATQYYQRLNRLIEREDALAHDPLLVKRLQRLRAKRQRQRAVAMRPYGY